MTMGGIRTVAVIDIGKTNAKVALVDLETLAETAVRKTANAVVRDGLYPHYDIEGLWSSILDGLAELNRETRIDAISVTAHGATCALIDRYGALALPVLDYEHDGPDQLTADYNAVRPHFSETGTPRLPVGLNLGAQLFWQEKAFPEAFGKAETILMYPQYWSFRLTGVLANEVTSLGCHTDLWSPARRDYSSLVDRLGWRKLTASVRPASHRLGSILPEIASGTGLDPETPVYCGIHDSNASLLPHVLSRRPPFAVVSTGTWVVSMAMGGRAKKLDPARDTLINVNALGDPVPSARFMGGREYAVLTDSLEDSWSETDIDAVLTKGIFLSPSVQTGSGPFPDRKAEWINGQDVTPGERRVAASFYLAMITATCLDLIGADGVTITEGPFARNELFVRMLSAATGREVIANVGAATGTSIGAALLAARVSPGLVGQGQLVASPHASWGEYCRAWQTEVRRREEVAPVPSPRLRGEGARRADEGRHKP
jgi:sugar (pentulose or hexulose) kinase